MHSALTTWLFRCRACGLWAADLSPGPASKLGEDQRAAALEPLRVANFKVLLDRLETVMFLLDARVLDVGCAHGWFLGLAAQRGMVTEGIEPDAAIAEATRRRGLPVRTGSFPDDVEPSARYDLITFNDVLEHLPDVGGALEACRAHLAPGGKLAVTLPDSHGVLYQIACLWARAGRGAYLERLWQVGFPSPHLYYFNAMNLSRLAARHGFRLLHQDTLASMRVRGLWSRLAMDRSASGVAKVVTYGGLLLAHPLMRFVLPADILVQIYQREAGP